MAKRANKKEPGNGPTIKRIRAASGPEFGKVVRRAVAGTVLRIEGSGFGRRSSLVLVTFDEHKIEPFGLPFSDSELLVTAPLTPYPTSKLSLRVGRRQSNQVRFAVKRTPGASGPRGAASRKLFHSVDQLAAHTAAFARAAGELPEIEQATRETMISAADDLDGYRAASLRIVERWLEWLPFQDQAPTDLLKTIEFNDEIIEVSGVTERVDRAVETVFGEGGPVQQLVPGGCATLFTKAGATAVRGAAKSESSASSIAGLIGFILHEITKATEGVENLLKVIKPSAEAGVGAGLEGSVDAEFSPGDVVSAIAKLIDVIAQILIKIGQSGSAAALNLKLAAIIDGIGELQRKVDRQEEKNDRQETSLGRLISDAAEQGRKLDRLETKLEGQDTKLDRAESKLDRLEAKAETLDGTTRRIDQTTLRNLEALSILEAKADRAEGKLDQIMIITGDTRQKVETLLDNLQRVEGKIDALQQDVTFVRSEVTTIHGHVDQLLLDSQAIQNRLTAIQADLNAIQNLLFNIGRGVGDLGNKVDALQNDLDTLIATIDRIADQLREIDRDVDRLVAQIP